MTNQEKSEIEILLATEFDPICDECFFNGDCEEECKCTKAKNLIEEALEKQIPKKPTMRLRVEIEDFFCPCCDYPFDLTLPEWGRRFCGGCGQAIDWSDEDD